MAVTIAQFNIRDIEIQKAEKNSHGAFTWPITLKGQKHHPKIQIGDTANNLRVPFGPSRFSEQSRLSLDYSLAGNQTDIIEWAHAIDSFVLEHIWANIGDFFKKPPATKEVLKDMYCGIISKKEDWDACLKSKINPKTPVFHPLDGNRRGTLDDIAPGSHAVPIISIHSIWKMGENRIGVSIFTEALMLWPRVERSMDDLFQTTLFNDLQGDAVMCRAG
jgi:hypothetical protein